MEVSISHCTIDALISVAAVPVPQLRVRAIVVFFVLFRLLLLLWVDNRNPLRNPDILVVAVSCVAEHILGVSHGLSGRMSGVVVAFKERRL